MPTLAKLLQRPDIWRGDTLAIAPLPGIPSGFPELDAELPGNGWPRSGMIEILVDRTGIGELALLLPMLARLSATELAWLIFVAPPYLLYAPALEAGGIALSRLLIVAPPGRDAAWACERALETDGIGTIVAWLPEVRPIQLRRLQLAAEASRTPICLFRPIQVATHPSPAPLRLTLDSDGEHLQIRILKRRGNALNKPLDLIVPRPVAPPSRHALACPASTRPVTRSARQPA